MVYGTYFFNHFFNHMKLSNTTSYIYTVYLGCLLKQLKNNLSPFLLLI